MKTRLWKIIPTIRFTNYRTQFPTISEDCFREWFSIRRFWRGLLVMISVRHFEVCLDFRKDPLSELFVNEIKPK